MIMTNAVIQAAALLRGVGLELERQLPKGTLVALGLQVCSGGDERLDVAVLHQYPTAGITAHGHARYPLAALNMGEVLDWCVSKVGVAPSPTENTIARFREGIRIDAKLAGFPAGVQAEILPGPKIVLSASEAGLKVEGGAAGRNPAEAGEGPIV